MFIQLPNISYILGPYTRIPISIPFSNFLVHVGFEIFRKVIMKNVVFWDINAQFIPHGRHITSPL
jgi:hypothetical protein